MESPSAEELLAHAAFVRRVAEGLLRDPHDVDDVVQDAYVAALRAPPAHGLRSWLATVARNAARMRLRARRRRVAHELAAARPDRTPGTADTAGRMEIHRRLVEEVLAIEEPTRTIVVLRYLDGLPPRTIAARLKLPLDTVRSRLRRGLERLRGRLDAWSGGDRAAWALILLPILRDGKTAALLTGGAVVGKKTAAFVVVWAALATGLYVREASQPRAPVARAAEPRADLPRHEPVAEAPVPEPKLTAVQERNAFERRWLGSRMGPMRGSIVDERTRTPLAATIRLKFSGTLPDQTPVTYETTTAPDGTFELPAVHYPLTYEVEAAAEEQGIHAKTSLWLEEETASAKVQVTQEPLLTGEVVDTTGLPVADAVVCFGSGRQRWAPDRTDAAGRFRIKLREQPTDDAPLRVAAAAPGFRPSAGGVEQVAPNLWRARITLKPGARVLARLKSRDGLPAGNGQASLIVERTFPMGARLEEPSQDVIDLMWNARGGNRRGSLNVESTSLDARADAGGNVSFWFPFVPERAWLVVQDGRYRAVHEIPGIASDPDGTFDLGDLALPEPTSMRLRFVDDAGKPLAAVEVRLSDLDAVTMLLSTGDEVTTDQEGWAEIPNVIDGRRYRASGYAGTVGGLFADEFVAREGAVVTLKRS